MKKKIFAVIIGGIALAGCSMETPEVRTDKTDNGAALKFDASQPDQSKAQQAQPVQTKPVDSQSAPRAAQNNTLTNKKMYTTAPQLVIDTKKQYTATLHTSAGDVVIELAVAGTPITANNFVFLAKDHFYDGTIFHRTIPGFMIQGGDPQGTGVGSPGYKFNDEPFTGEYTRGTVAMANSGANTNGSQFFIMHKDYALPKSYVIFGHVTSGLDVVDKIATAPTKPGGEGSSPVAPVTVQTVDITEK